jgi:hypothetical protein
VVVVVGMFYHDIGREVLLNIVSKYFQAQNMEFSIKGLDKKISKIREIFIRSPDGIELTFSNIDLKRKNFLERSSIYVDKFTLKGAEEKIDLNKKLKDLIPLMRTLRFFISYLSLGKGFMTITGEKYLLDELTYKSTEKDDYLYSKINKTQSLDVLFRWDREECIESNIVFEKILGFSGTLFITSPEGAAAGYKFVAENDSLRIVSDGSYRDFMFSIKIRDAFVWYKQKKYNCYGSLSLEEQRANITSKIPLENLVDSNSFSTVILETFKNVFAHININYNFKEKTKSSADVIFKKFGKDIGDLKCAFADRKCKFSGNISWINVYNFAFSNFSCEIDNFQKAKIKVFGENLEISSDVKINDQILIEKVEAKSKLCSLRSAHPFLLCKDMKCLFVFDCKKVDFLSGIFDGSASGNGVFEYKNGKITLKGDLKNAAFGNYQFSQTSFVLNGEDLNLTTKNAKIFNINLSDLVLNISKNELNLFGKVNGDYRLNAFGKISGFFKKISLKKCEIASSKDKIELPICDLDFVLNSYRVDCVLSEKKSKEIGRMQMMLNVDELKLDAKAFQINRFVKLFNYWAPNSKLTGRLELKSKNGIFIGIGSFSLFNLMAKKNLLSIDSNISSNGIEIYAKLENRENKVCADSFLPIAIRTDWLISKNTSSNLFRCHVYGNSHLEKLCELSDNLDVRGMLNCDFHVGGTFSNPIINGRVEWQNARISVGDILLKNGDILLVGEGKNIRVSRARFVDSNKKKLSIAGIGKLFFNGIIPNINADLRLVFNNFMLFDSENIKIKVNGNASMGGAINDMFMTGKVDIPLCELHYFESPEAKLDKDIIFENDPFLRVEENKKTAFKKDFFKYDVSLHCPKINFLGNIFEIILNGDLKLATYQHKTTLIGELKLVNGKLNLFGKRMLFTKGCVEFFEQFPFDPEALFVCKKSFSDMKVALKIKNTPNKGAFLELYSNPNYSKDVILSKIIFGKELKYLSVAETAQLANALAGFNQRGYIFSMLNAFQETGIIDNISFVSEDNKPSSLYVDTRGTHNQQNMNISAGKYIHDSLYISVNKKENAATFDIDFSVTPTISIKANTGGEAGASWKYRY